MPIRCLRARSVVSVFLRIPDALAQVHGKSQGRLHGRIPTRSYTLWDLSSCPPGFIFLVTRLIPRKHATSSSFFEVGDWFSWRYKSPKCLEIRIYECMHEINTCRPHSELSRDRLIILFLFSRVKLYNIRKEIAANL